MGTLQRADHWCDVTKSPKLTDREYTLTIRAALAGFWRMAFLNEGWARAAATNRYSPAHAR
jgi:hypothetical protein